MFISRKKIKIQLKNNRSQYYLKTFIFVFFQRKEKEKLKLKINEKIKFKTNNLRKIICDIHIK